MSKKNATSKPAAASAVLKKPLSDLGFGFIEPPHIPPDKSEYYIRFQQNKRTNFKPLTTEQIKELTNNGNTADNWKNVLVHSHCAIAQIKNCTFYGLVRIGKIEAYSLHYKGLRLPVGLYNSTLISSDIGDNCVIKNVSLLSHYIVGDEVILTDIDTLSTSPTAKFGNGIIKAGETEQQRIQLEVCNENGKRKISPFNGMLSGDAYLWATNVHQPALVNKLQSFTDQLFDTRRGYYGTIGNRSVLRSTRIIKDVLIGEETYIKGSNKLKNLTIHSSSLHKTQIGEGCELVNGIIGYGCKIFYGVKAVRFVLADNSQLKYGARLINSYLGNNSTISCCEVLNTLIFPSHEQHHNNSFLCAAQIQGQSNIAAGVTIGSNHNSRGADGEIIAGRGFWPGLCVSLKHHSKFASYTMIAKGHYAYELLIPLPFSLISINHNDNSLEVMPAYWFLYNLYALERNTRKLGRRNLVLPSHQHLEFNYLAPDTVYEMVKALSILEELTGKAYFKSKGNKETLTANDYRLKGKNLLETQDPVVDALTIVADNFENSKRTVKIVKVPEAYPIFKRLIQLYFVQTYHQLKPNIDTLNPSPRIEPWLNAGGQLIPESEWDQLKTAIASGKINSWQAVHSFYQEQNKSYLKQQLQHALTALSITDPAFVINKSYIRSFLIEGQKTTHWIFEQIMKSRKKDYTNPYRQSIYQTKAEMDFIIGRFEDDELIEAYKSKHSYIVH